MSHFVVGLALRAVFQNSKTLKYTQTKPPMYYKLDWTRMLHNIQQDPTRIARSNGSISHGNKQQKKSGLKNYVREGTLRYRTNGAISILIQRSLCHPVSVPPHAKLNLLRKKGKPSVISAIPINSLTTVPVPRKRIRKS